MNDRDGHGNWNREVPVSERRIPSFESTASQFEALRSQLREKRHAKRVHVKMAAFLRQAPELLAEASKEMTPTEFEAAVQAEIQRSKVAAIRKAAKNGTKTEGDIVLPTFQR